MPRKVVIDDRGMNKEIQDYLKKAKKFDEQLFGKKTTSTPKKATKKTVKKATKK